MPADVFAGAGSDRVRGGSGNDKIFGDLAFLEELGPGPLGMAPTIPIADATTDAFTARLEPPVVQSSLRYRWWKGSSA